MLNLLFTFLIIPFVPVFFYGGFFDDGRLNDIAQSPQSVFSSFSVGESVLGATSEGTSELSSQSDGFQSCNLFPVYSGSAEYVPERTKDYVDTKIFAGSSVAIDVESGTILHYDNGRKRTQVASLTKMMTAVLVMENIKDLNEKVKITSEALAVPGTIVGCPTSTFCNANRMYRGEEVRAVDLLKVMLLNSANDAATALAIHMTGSSSDFANMMNDKAKSLGLKDTHFCTPSGLEIDGHEDECYSSAYDLARIASYSLKYKQIWDIMKIPDGQFYSVDGKYMHEMKNTDMLLDQLPNCIGGKTGFTPLAGKSLMLGSTDPTGKHKVISVILNDESRWDDMKKLVNWIYNNYEWR